jgi:hypothetical protein
MASVRVEIETRDIPLVEHACHALDRGLQFGPV